MLDVPDTASPALGISARLSGPGWAFVPGAKLLDAVGVGGTNDWHDFAQHWDRLLLDEYMRDGGTYRYRRYGRLSFDAARGELTLMPHEPYEQSSAVNKLNGGFKRHFEPLEDTFVEGVRPLLRTLGHEVAEASGHATWSIRLHPYRVVARPDVVGQPVPEGMHRDGVDVIVSMMVRRTNVSGGVSTIADEQGTPMAQVELSTPGDLLIGDDHRTMHDVTPVQVVDPRQPVAYRDVLVIAFEKADP